MIRCIVACDENWGMGKNNNLPWPHNSNDLKWFKKTTTNSTVMMGRKTWESLPVKPLPGRVNIVVSNTSPNNMNGVIWTSDPFSTLSNKSFGTIDIIGGVGLITSCFDHIDQFLISNIPGVYDCDVFFPHVILQRNYTPTKQYDNELQIDFTEWNKKRE